MAQDMKLQNKDTLSSRWKFIFNTFDRFWAGSRHDSKGVRELKLTW